MVACGSCVAGGFTGRFGAFGKVTALMRYLAGHTSCASSDGQHGKIIGGQLVGETVVRKEGEERG